MKPDLTCYHNSLLLLKKFLYFSGKKKPKAKKNFLYFSEKKVSYISEWMLTKHKISYIPYTLG